MQPSDEPTNAQGSGSTPNEPDKPNKPKDTVPKPSPTPQIGDQLEPELDYETAFEQTGHGQFSYFVVFACMCIFMHALVEMVGFAYVADPAECDLNLSVSQKTLIGNAVFIGIILTAICWGSVTDHIGRRKVMLPALLFSMIFSTGSSLATSFWMMFFFRLFSGVFVSASSATVCVYLGELEVAKYRDKSISIVVSAVAVLFCFLPAIGWCIIPGKWYFYIGSMRINPWRVFMWMWSIPGMTGMVTLLFLPESPNFVYSHSNNDAETLHTLAEIYARNTFKAITSFPVHHLKRVTSTGNHEHGLKAALLEMSQLVRVPLLRPFFVTHYCMFITFLLANGVYLWVPGIFNILIQDLSLPWSICHAIKSKYEETKSQHSEKNLIDVLMGGDQGPVDCSGDVVNIMVYPMSIAMEVVLVIPFVIVTVIIDKINKCYLYMFMMTPCAVFILISSLVPNLVAAGIVLTLGVCSGSGASILSALAVEAFPTKLRALSMCTMYMMGHFGAIFGNTLMSLGSTGPCVWVFGIISALTAGSVLSIVFLWPDIKVVQQIMEARNYPY